MPDQVARFEASHFLFGHGGHASALGASGGATCTVTLGLISFCFSPWGACPPGAGLPLLLDARPSRPAPCLRARRYRFDRSALVGSLGLACGSDVALGKRVTLSVG